MRKNRICVKYYSYHIRLLRQGRKKNAFFKIVIVNSKNRIVSSLGYFIPHSSKNFKIKSIGINRNLTILWLLKHAIPSFFILFLFESIGLLKYNKLKLKQF
jgi:ribosomal protein S16